jgi:hypothetical protein
MQAKKKLALHQQDIISERHCPSLILPAAGLRQILHLRGNPFIILDRIVVSVTLNRLCVDVMLCRWLVALILVIP